MASMKTLSVLFSALVVALLTILSHPVQSSPVPGWLCAVGTPAAYDRFCDAGKEISQIQCVYYGRMEIVNNQLIKSFITRLYNSRQAK